MWYTWNHFIAQYLESAVPPIDVEVLLPVHNEGESIEATIRGIHAELAKVVNPGFIICEDGSKDNTKQILRQLSAELPMRLNLSDARKGYSKAVCEGMAIPTLVSGGSVGKLIFLGAQLADRRQIVMAQLLQAHDVVIKFRLLLIQTFNFTVEIFVLSGQALDLSIEASGLFA